MARQPRRHSAVSTMGDCALHGHRLGPPHPTGGGYFFDPKHHCVHDGECGKTIQSYFLEGDTRIRAMRSFKVDARRLGVFGLRGKKSIEWWHAWKKVSSVWGTFVVSVGYHGEKKASRPG